MKNGGRTLMFPLSSLALLKTTGMDDFLNKILGYGVFHAGRKMLEDAGGAAKFIDTERYPFKEVKERASELGLGEMHDLSEIELTTLVGLFYCGVRIGSCSGLTNFYNSWRKLETYSVKMARNTAVKRDAMVRIHIDLFFDVRDEEALHPLAFRILCAVYSSIGKSPFKRIAASVVARRSTGAMKRPPRSEVRKKLPYEPTERQTRYALEKLWKRGFFRMVSGGQNRKSGLGPNKTYYSRTAKTDEELAVLIRKTLKSLKKKVLL
jgi:hypothetical protein